MSEIILIVLEGEKAEHIFIKSIKDHFFKKENVIFIPVTNGGTIYQIYKEINDDGDLDIFPLLKERITGNADLEKIKSRDLVSEIHLFFDYDGHDPTATVDKMLDFLNIFQNETESGKLYVSYPMVEANRHLTTTNNFKDSTFLVSDGKKYKEIVGNSSDQAYKDVAKYTKEIWLDLSSQHIKKANYIANSKFELPDEKCISKDLNQKNIFLSQIKNFFEINGHVAILGAFPFFICEYFGDKFLSELRGLKS